MRADARTDQYGVERICCSSLGQFCSFGGAWARTKKLLAGEVLLAGGGSVAMLEKGNSK